MEGFQLIPFDLGSQAWVANQPLMFSLQNLQTFIGMGIGHTVFFDFELQITPTYTTAPTIVGLNNAIAGLQIYDGERQWLPTGASFNMLRMFERVENGRIILPDPVTNGASAGLRVVRRRYAWAPPQMYGQPSDSAMPNAILNQGGYIQATCSPLTSISADTTAATGTLQITAWQARYFNKLVMPSWHERLMMAITNGQQFNQEALYSSIAFLNSSSFDAFAAGDIGNVTLNTGTEYPMSSIGASRLTAAHNADFMVGQFDPVNGDPLSATLDINGRTMNSGTPTAITNTPIDLQVVSSAPRDCRLTKLNVNVPATLTVSFSGSNSGTQALLARFRKLGAVERGVSLAKALIRLPGRTAKDFGLRLSDDTESYKGPLAGYLPWQARLNSLPY